MNLFILLNIFACVVVGRVAEASLPTDPLLEADVIGEPLSDIDFEAAESIADLGETNVEYDQIRRDPTENAGVDEDFFEGDISLFGQEDPQTQNVAVRGQSKRWPRGQVPYYISSEFSSYERAVIAKAFQQYKKNTCIRFIPRTNQRNYVHIVKGGGCSSLVGRWGGAQRLTLGSGCVHVGVIVHEALHAVGFWHEQSRPDRDNYVSIYWKNIMSGLSYNFQAKSNHAVELTELPYDQGSIMHYGKYAFTNGKGPTIVTKDGGSIGQRRGLSSMDIKKINKLYKCSGGVKPRVRTTARPTVRPTRKPGKKCADKHKYCADWSKKGTCRVNPAYMKLYCKKACGFC